MKKSTYTLAVLFLLFSCAPIKKRGYEARLVPSLGLMGKEQKSLLHKEFEPIGKPHIADAILLSVREIQFNKAKFKAYSNYKMARGEALNMAYADSLRIKPKYLCLELSDRIAMKSVLNNESNKDVRSYLSNDEDYRMVTQITLVANDQNTRQLVAADGIFLRESRNGILEIELLDNDERTKLDFSGWDIFDYKLSGFCWGEDNYGNPRIETLNDTGGCPEGTEKNAQKLDRTKSYLKL